VLFPVCLLKLDETDVPIPTVPQPKALVTTPILLVLYVVFSFSNSAFLRLAQPFGFAALLPRTVPSTACIMHAHARARDRLNKKKTAGPPTRPGCRRHGKGRKKARRRNSQQASREPVNRSSSTARTGMSMIG
jgi:hypothetical protein